MRNKPQMTLEDAYKIADAARGAAAKRNGSAGTIAIVDSGGHLLYLERPDRQSPNSVEIATLKARTSAIFRSPTKTLEDVAKDRPGTLAFPNRLPVQGGLPIMFEGQCVGGIGVSGVKSHEDEQVASVGLNALL